MVTTPFLFSVKPYSSIRRRRSGSALPTGVQIALDQLRNTMEAIPPEVMAERRQAWEALRRATPVLPPSPNRQRRP